MAAKASKPPLQKVGKYPIVAPIAQGGMGTVYKARHPDTGELVAIKVLAPDIACDADLLKRFEQEYEVTRSLSHPHTVQALDFGVDGAHHYLVMEFVDGQTLGKRVEKEGRLPEEEAIRLTLQVAGALHEMHQRGFIHRDVKPDNILVGKDGRAKLSDLGMVKNTESDMGLTLAGVAMGTPHFMAPEQLEDAKHVDLRCDIYGLGATLYMAVTGELPFGSRTYLGFIKMKASSELTPPRQLVPALSKRTDAVIRRAMQGDPAKRFASFPEFMAALRGESLAPPAAVGQPAVERAKRGRERRAMVRYSTERDGLCQPLGEEKQLQWAGKVLDVSAGGVRLQLRRRFEPGTVLCVDLAGKGKEEPERLLVRVVHVQQEGPRKYHIGCAFAHQLSDDEVDSMR